ncbi:MAG: hypothetical protein E7331_09935 [Clostridiales bacterium]|nr:hypothetical protein [Clostridiales bacterium]
MNHSDEAVGRPFSEGAAVRIGPLAPGEAEDEYHVYFHQGEKARTLFISRDLEPEPLRLTVRLILNGAKPGRSILASLRLLETDENNREKARGFRLLLIPGAEGPKNEENEEDERMLSVEAPPVQFLLSREDARPERHFIIRVNARYAEDGSNRA